MENNNLVTFEVLQQFKVDNSWPVSSRVIEDSDMELMYLCSCPALLHPMELQFMFNSLCLTPITSMSFTQRRAIEVLNTKGITFSKLLDKSTWDEI